MGGGKSRNLIEERREFEGTKGNQEEKGRDKKGKKMKRNYESGKRNIDKKNNNWGRTDLKKINKN